MLLIFILFLFQKPGEKFNGVMKIKEKTMLNFLYFKNNLNKLKGN
jgi:hypothetical protein